MRFLRAIVITKFRAHARDTVPSNTPTTGTQKSSPFKQERIHFITKTEASAKGLSSSGSYCTAGCLYLTAHAAVQLICPFCFSDTVHPAFFSCSTNANNSAD